MALTDTQRIKVRDDVLSKVLDGEAVLMDLRSGTYFGMNEVATEIWELLKVGATVAAIREKLLETFEVDRATVEADLERLIATLQERGLVDIR